MVFTMNITLEYKKQINKCLEVLKEILGADLSAVFLYGSAVSSGLKKYSDIDLLVVVNRSLSIDEKRVLVNNLLEISGRYMMSEKRSIELTVVNYNSINPWIYPPVCEFQYGEWLRSEFEDRKSDHLYSPQLMPDLAVIITQVLNKSELLFGKAAYEVLPSISKKDLICAMVSDLGRLMSEIQTDTRNVLLTLCRILCTLKTGIIYSKEESAELILFHLPNEHHRIINKAKNIYLGLEDDIWSNDDLRNAQDCASSIICKIKLFAK